MLSLPEPERKSVLVEANSLFLADLLGFGMDLQRAYRQGYAFDPRNSAITQVREAPDALVLEVLGHYATASIAIPQPGTPPGVPQPSAPRSLPDPRSLFLTIHYSLARLPAVPMHGRHADPRVGYFESGRFDFSNDLQRTPRQRFVNRWRLEKKDPQAALSEPVKPIVFWIDRTVPYKYRAPITAGVLEWNKAFEKIGFKNAIRVEVQPDNADFDTLDFGRASIRWMTNASPTFGAIGPSHVDPRSGEILDADIGIESLSSRNIRAARSQILSASGVDNPFRDADPTPQELALLMTGRVCTYGELAAEQMTYGTDVLEARGDLEPGSPEAESFVDAYLKDVTMHEVGHTLGLRHNFRASRVYTQPQLADPAFTKANGIAGSVMEYAPINLNSADEPRDHYGTPFNDTLGPYDYWAIEYAYKPLPSGLSAADEHAALEKIAGRSAEPLLAYGTDEDNFIGVDPETLQFDLGSDVIALRQEADRDRAGAAEAPGDAEPAARPGLQRPEALGQLCDARRRARRLRAGAPDRRRAHGARRARHRPRSAHAGAGRRAARSARRDHRQPALGRQLPRLAGAAAKARHRLQRAPRGAAWAARARRRPTIRRPSSCSGCSARCSPC